MTNRHQRTAIVFGLLGIAIALTLLPVFSVRAAELLAVEATLNPPAPTTVRAGQPPISASVDFGRRFASIDEVCFNFVFEGDLLDPGDNQTSDRLRIVEVGGFFNTSGSPQSTRTLCNPTDSGHPDIASLLLDGKAEFEIMMATGSVTIRSLRVEVVGTPAPQPTAKDQCMNGGYRSFTDPSTGRPFKNQGQCIQFVNTGR